MGRFSVRLQPRNDQKDPPAKLSWQTLGEAVHLIRYLRPYLLLFILALLALALNSLLSLAFPLMTGQIVDRAIQKQGQEASTWWQGIDGITLSLFGIIILKASLSFFQSYSFTIVGEKSLADLRRGSYAHLVRLPMAFHGQHRIGELSSRMAADLTQLQGTLTGTFPEILRQLTILIGGLIVIIATSLRLTLVLLCSLPIVIGIAVYFGAAIRKNASQAQDRLAESNVIVEETLQGLSSVKSFTNENYEENRYSQSLGQYVKATLAGGWARGAFVSFIVIALFGSILLVIWAGAHQVTAGNITLGELSRFMLLAVFVGGAMGSFADLYSQLLRTLGATQRIREILKEKPEHLTNLQEHVKSNAPRFRGEVNLENVVFHYPSRPDVTVLRGVSFSIPAGKRIALVGPSGAGKSTVVALLLRFFDPSAGVIRIDGVNARDYSLEHLRGQMAVVPQDVILFGGNIGENIAYGRPGASQEAIVEAARKANAHDFIIGFPDGYETRVGDRGIQLSGGQRQRVAIARAILRDPAILILDEATSSLDSESEALVLQALDRLMLGRTSLVIAHRLSTVRSADSILVLTDGAIVEQGTHEELSLQDGGIYRQLSELQSH